MMDAGILSGAVPRLASSVSPAVLTRIPASGRVIYLTFDDGPGAGTNALLQMLAACGARATFFFSGAALDNHESGGRIAIETLEDGHAVGVHGYEHLNAWLAGSRAAVADHRKGLDSLRRAMAGGREPATARTPIRYTRPPYGKLTPALLTAYRHAALRAVLWDVDPLDYRASPGETDAVIERVRRRVRPGSIVLLHPHCRAWKDDPSALSRLLDLLAADGWRLEPLP